MPVGRKTQPSWLPARSFPGLWRPRSAASVSLPRAERRPRFGPRGETPRASYRKKQNKCDASPETNQIFYHATIIAADTEIPKQHELIVDLETRSRLLLTRARIDRANIQIQTIEN